MIQSHPMERHPQLKAKMIPQMRKWSDWIGKNSLRRWQRVQQSGLNLISDCKYMQIIYVTCSLRRRFVVYCEDCFQIWTFFLLICISSDHLTLCTIANSIQILYNVLSPFPMVLTRKTCLPIKRLLIQCSFPSFL